MPPAAVPALNKQIMPNLLNAGPSAFSDSGAYEQIWWTVYDRVAITTAVAASPTMFQTAGTDPLVSNFEGSGGAFPQGQAFWVHTLRFIMDIGTSFPNALNLLKYIAILFTVDNAKKYAYAPAWQFPAAVGLQAENVVGNAAPATPATGFTYGNSGLPSLGNAYTFRLPIALRPQQRFTIQLLVNAAVTLVAGPINVYVAMDGYLQRNLQ